MRPLATLFKAGLLFSAMTLTAQTFESPEERVPLLELFTSEGCSSCPPAEKWLGKLIDHPDLWKEFVPVAFHVDYWNNLGWKDRFSSPEFTKRQRLYAAEWGSSTVYTPGFVLNGKAWKPSRDLPTASDEKPGKLIARVGEGGKIDVTFRPITKTPEPRNFTLALLGRGVNTAVMQGENAGRSLRHDFLVLGILQLESQPLEDGQYAGTFTLPKDTPTPISGVAVWISEPKSQAPIQATGGWLIE